METPFPPAHTAEHLLNQTMIRIFGCQRSAHALIERKKSTMNFFLGHKPSRQEEKEIERRMNEVIDDDLPITFVSVPFDHLSGTVDVDTLPVDELRQLSVSDDTTVRVACIGDYDACPCLGRHVRSTSQVGRFELIGTNWNEHEHLFTIRFKVIV